VALALVSLHALGRPAVAVGFARQSVLISHEFRGAFQMILRRILTLAAFGVLALGTVPAMAQSTGAYASDKISIFEGPHYRANEIVGMLLPGEAVTIQRCTPDGQWCRVFSHEPTGWVPASYLIGAAAKANATPLQSLTTPPAVPMQKPFKSGGGWSF
jgi:uncharacterized protein YraI